MTARGAQYSSSMPVSYDTKRNVLLPGVAPVVWHGQSKQCLYRLQSGAPGPPAACDPDDISNGQVPVLNSQPRLPHLLEGQNIERGRSSDTLG